LAAAGAAILSQISDHPIHGIEVGAIDELTTLSSLADETRSLKALKMEGKRRGDQPQPGGDMACRQPIRTPLNQQPVDREPVLMRQRPKRCDHIFGFHVYTIFR
jgi:hypothetical protein